MTTLVTGATGLVGNNVVRMLLDRGESVCVLQREESDPRPLAGLDVERFVGDVRDADSVRRACQGADRVIHAAAYVHIGWKYLPKFRAINVEGTRHVAHAARDAGARMVHVSSVDAFGLAPDGQPADENTPPDPNDKVPYVISKREAEQVIFSAVRQGLNASIVNPTFMLGPWDWKPSSGRMVLQVGRRRIPLSPRGGNDFCDVRDVAAGILAALDRGQVGRQYILGGEPLSYLEAFRLIANVTGSYAPRRRASRFAIRMLGFYGNTWAFFARKEFDVNSAAGMMSNQEHHFSYARAAKELDYRPRPAREAVVASWNWFREHGYAPWAASRPAVVEEPQPSNSTPLSGTSRADGSHQLGSRPSSQSRQHR